MPPIGTIEMLISLYKKDADFIEFQKWFSELTVAYEGIKLIYHEGEITEYEDENGDLVVEDNSTTEIVASKEDVAKVAAVAKKIRENLIKLK